MLEGKPADHGILAEAGAHAVDGVLGLRGPAVDKIGGIGLVGRGQRAQSDSEQAKSGAVGFAFKEPARRGENPLRELGRSSPVSGRGCGF